MRNAVIRKKRLNEQRIVEQYMRYPQRIQIGNIEAVGDWMQITPQPLMALQ